MFPNKILVYVQDVNYKMNHLWFFHNWGGWDSTRREMLPRAHLRPLRTTPSNTCWGTVITAISHHIVMLLLGEGMWSSPAPRCGAPLISKWDRESPQTLTCVALLQRRSATLRRQRYPSCTVPRLWTGYNPDGLMLLSAGIPRRSACHPAVATGGGRSPPPPKELLAGGYPPEQGLVEGINTLHDPLHAGHLLPYGREVSSTATSCYVRQRSEERRT